MTGAYCRTQPFLHFFHKLATIEMVDCWRNTATTWYQWYYPVGSQTLLDAGTNHQISYTEINKTIISDPTNIVKLLIHNLYYIFNEQYFFLHISANSVDKNIKKKYLSTEIVSKWLLNRNIYWNILHDVTHLSLYRMGHLPWVLPSGWVISLSSMCWNWLPRSRSPRWATHHAWFTWLHQYANKYPWGAMTQMFNQTNVLFLWSLASSPAFSTCSPLASLHRSPSSVSTISCTLLLLLTDHYREASDEFPWDSRWDFGCFRGWR